ncbi:fructosamine kinase family protein [Alkalibacillus salilacus]|uniref:Fructosamine-3-kinase n=1 Tax=Alkalibacillus salilacus TaxID=284582 RepID=A0ABT9VCT7_9BACI|nr:fructosamine kinase family protein [Alkalibacillus salilacus]MDQ0158782.1 fructosamine-3-kinase [Alkalibacillus salilacus]
MSVRLEKIISDVTGESINRMKAVSGGDINDSYYVQTMDREYFVKVNKQGPEAFFNREVEGLNKINETNTINVPSMIDVNDHDDLSYLILEWIDAQKHGDERQLGEQIGQLHNRIHNHFGYPHFTYVGTLKQPNDLYGSWNKYYRDQRLLNQIQIGESLGVIKGEREKKIHQLLERIENLIPEKPDASYLHGDLWSGNWMFSKDGEPYVIDPSFLYGDRHFELAFTELFGGFSNKFYEGYRSTNHIEPYYSDVKPIYQLFYLLVHLNIFGEVYGSSVDRIVNYYVG